MSAPAPRSTAIYWLGSLVVVQAGIIGLLLWLKWHNSALQDINKQIADLRSELRDLHTVVDKQRDETTQIFNASSDLRSALTSAKTSVDELKKALASSDINLININLLKLSGSLELQKGALDKLDTDIKSLGDKLSHSASPAIPCNPLDPDCKK